MTDTIDLTHRAEFRGAAWALMSCRDEEVLIAGPAGTGKSLAALTKGLLLALAHAPGSRFRGLIVRKTMASLGATGLDTWRKHVATEALATGACSFYGGSSAEPPQYRFLNGSVIVVGGLDRPSKIMSSEYDWIFVQEATELTEEDWESLTTRLRNGAISFQQLVGDCNPGPPTHWLKQRCNSGQTTILESRHEDNPRYFTADGTITDAGAEYIGKLDNLTGARKNRLRYGQWVAAEGVIYEEFDDAVHLIDRRPLPRDWPRFWVVDFGYSHPFVCYDDQTEVLTDGGWKLFCDLDHTEAVATVNADSHAMEWQRPTDYIEQRYSGPMVTLESQRAGANFSVTPNHRMVLENRKRGGWSFHAASEMPTGNYGIPVGWEPLRGGIAADVNRARFLGLWLADGCITFGSYEGRQRSVRVAQKNHVAEVRQMFAALDVTWSEREDANGVIDFRTNDPDLGDWLYGLCGKVRSNAKRIPPVCLSWNRPALEALLDGLRLGDGWPTRYNSDETIAVTGAYCTTSAGLADDVQAVASLLGLPTATSRLRKVSGYTGEPIDVFTVRFRKARRAVLTGNVKLQTRDYDGAVYCVTVPNATLVVRRGGRPMVSGNCQRWAEDPDGRLIRYAEQYHTGRLVEDHARDVMVAVTRVVKGEKSLPEDTESAAAVLAAVAEGRRRWGEPEPEAIICDHDAEGRATLERHLGRQTTPAYKAVLEGIEAVQSRMKIAGDGLPRLQLMRDAVYERDPAQVEAKLPASTVEEIPGYVWKPTTKPKEEPLKENDDGCDCMRYMVAHRDLNRAEPRFRWLD